MTASRSIQSRVAYLRYLRREHRRSPRVEADAFGLISTTHADFFPQRQVIRAFSA